LLLGRSDPGSPESIEIANTSGGNPYMVHEVASWVSAHGAREGLTAEDVVRERVDALSDDARRLLRLIAVAGQPLPVAAAQGAGSLADILSPRDELVSKRLARLRLVEGHEEIEVYHDRVRHAVLANLDSATTADLHGRLARGLGLAGLDDPERMAVHLEAAGNSEFRHHAIRAADRALDALAFNKAADFYQRAIRGGAASAPDLGELYGKLGDSYSNAGRGAAAANAFIEAAAFSGGRGGLILRAKAASQLLRCGHLPQGLELLNNLLKQVGIHPARTRPTTVLSIAAYRARLSLKGIRAPSATMARSMTEDERLRLDLAWSGVLGLALIDPLRSAEFSARYVWLAIRSGDPYRVCLGFAAEATMRAMTAPGGRDRTGERLLAVAFELAQQIQNPHAHALCLMVSGVTAYLQGNWELASTRCDESAAVLRAQCANVAWELSVCTIVATIGRQVRGAWSENRRRLPEFVRDAEARGDLTATLSFRLLALSYVLDVADDEPDRALVQLRRDLDASPPGEHAMQKANALQAETDVALYRGRPREAWQAIAARWRELESSGTLRVSVTFAFSMFTRGRAALAVATLPEIDPGERRAMLSEVRAAISSLVRRAPAWSRGMARLLAAGVATFEPDAGTVARELATAADELKAANLVPYYVAATARRTGYESEAVARQLRGEVDEWTTREGVVQLDSLISAIAPGNFQPPASRCLARPPSL
jgi:tetratricopeptide (TPR) repeat protein